MKMTQQIRALDILFHSTQETGGGGTAHQAVIEDQGENHRFGPLAVLRLRGFTNDANTQDGDFGQVDQPG